LYTDSKGENESNEKILENERESTNDQETDLKRIWKLPERIDKSRARAYTRGVTDLFIANERESTNILETEGFKGEKENNNEKKI